MSKHISKLFVAALVLLVLQGMGVMAAEPAAPEEFSAADINLDWGGDIRIRNVHFADIPIVVGGVTRENINHFWRFRTRLWGHADLTENISVKGRIVNESRRYYQPTDQSSWDSLDEIVVDQLYVDFNNLLGEKVDLRIGRQDLIYGTGKVILEGTPKDGSRTIYHNAIRLRYRANETCTLDVLGIYNSPENELAINSRDRDLTGWDPAYNDLTESGGGVYLQSKRFASTPFELYYLFKNESTWTDRSGTAMPERDINTVGFRVMPKLADTVDAALEAAYQRGEIDDAAGSDQDGYMVDATINWHLPILEDLKPCLSVGYYGLSGDDPDTADDEGWDPLWARWPQYSELYIYAFDADGAGRWSNVSMPHVNASVKINDNLKLRGMVGLLNAMEENGPGAGDERGLLGTLRADFVLAKGLLGETDKLFGHLIAEYLDPGDYYEVDDAAHFVRCELSYAF